MIKRGMKINDSIHFSTVPGHTLLNMVVLKRLIRVPQAEKIHAIRRLLDMGADINREDGSH